MPLPLVKLGSLFIKTLSKPLANAIKRNVKSQPRLSQAIALPAQGYHRLEQTVRMKLMGWTKKVDVKPLSSEAAVDLGAELLGEFIIFSIAALTVFYEYKRGQNKDKAKENLQNQKLISLQEQINELGLELKTHVSKQISLENQIQGLEQKLYKNKNK